MAATFNKPANLKYTDLAIYIDANAFKIKNEGEYPEVEAKIYEYLYHILYALACKAGYFRQFDDYDYYACYGAGEIFMAMRKKLLNEGKEIRGKKVVPIKSSLNFIKATMFPLKINYQKDYFGEIIDPAIHSNTEVLKENLTEAIQQQYRPSMIETYYETANEIPGLIRKVIKKTPFRNHKDLCQKLYLSITLTLLNDLTVPTKLYKKLTKTLENNPSKKATKKLIGSYVNNIEPALLWHLDAGFQNYVRILTIKVKSLISRSFENNAHSGELSDELLDRLMRTAYENYDVKGDMD